MLTLNTACVWTKNKREQNEHKSSGIAGNLNNHQGGDQDSETGVNNQDPNPEVKSQVPENQDKSQLGGQQTQSANTKILCDSANTGSAEKFKEQLTKLVAARDVNYGEVLVEAVKGNKSANVAIIRKNQAIALAKNPKLRPKAQDYSKAIIEATKLGKGKYDVLKELFPTKSLSSTRTSSDITRGLKSAGIKEALKNLVAKKTEEDIKGIKLLVSNAIGLKISAEDFAELLWDGDNNDQTREALLKYKYLKNRGNVVGMLSTEKQGFYKKVLPILKKKADTEEGRKKYQKLEDLIVKKKRVKRPTK
ncbi:MAG: hypothetical protein AAF963_01795 [Bacteroidota bacterium]